jgi:AcrR family transcriptional regulator
MVTKGESTRHEILEHAARQARVLGLAGVTIGPLAKDLGMSKSGLFAHFGSKEALQIAILEHTSARFVDAVVRPALARPRGEPRLRHAFEGWLAWGLASGDASVDAPNTGGCLFVAATAELDDQPGPVRDHLVAIQRDWLDALAQMVRSGQRDGGLARDADPDQVAFELQGILLAAHQSWRLFSDPRAVERARLAFDRLLRSLSVTS